MGTSPVETEPIPAARLLAEVEALVQLGHWEWLPDQNSVRWSAELYRIFDLQPETFPATVEGYLDMVHPHDRDRTRAMITHTLETGEPFDHVERIVLHSGEVRWLRSRGVADRDDAGRTRRLFGTCQDITDQRMLEHQLMQAQKMESLGRLAGGVAHDFNNLLSVMLTFSGMLASDQSASETSRGWAAQILKAANRAAGLTRRLLDFSRRRAVSLQAVDVDAVCRGMVSMLDRLLGDDVELVLDLHATPWTALADSGQLEQVMLNLAVNARDAMPHGGRLRISTVQHSPEQPPPPEVGLKAGEWIHIRVSDTGTGMDEDTLEKVFDPFFTTKERGEGTGLGLAIVHGFAKSHGGAVWAESEKNVGTTVHMWLPKTVLRPHAEKATEASERFSCPTPGTILLVEDEEQVMYTLRTILERAGCKVVSADDMEAALDVLRARKAEIALLVTDVVMPHGGGRELAERAHQLHPELPVLFISGHPDDDLVIHEKLSPDAPFLQKPFTADDLLNAIRELLGSVPGAVTTE